MPRDTVGPFLYEADNAARSGHRSAAQALYQEIADAGDDRAWAPLGDLLAADPGSDVVTAVECYRRGAEADDAIAALRLGEAYERGTGVAADPAQALDWYDRSADLGLARGATAAGRLLADGAFGTPEDAAAEARWERAVALGDEPDALLGLSRLALQREDQVAAVGWAIRASYVTRRLLYEPEPAPYSPVDLVSGTEALAHDLEAALDLVNRNRMEVYDAARDGDPAACWHWGRIEALGFGESPDPEEGQQWIERAADAGHAEAMHALAQEDRKTGNLDSFEGRLRAAAAQGHPAALRDLGYALYSGAFGGETDLTGARVAYRAAAEAGREGSATDLSFILEDLDEQGAAAESVRWLRLAADAGHVPAIRRLAERLRAGDGLEHDDADALRWFLAAYYRGWSDGLDEVRSLAAGLAPTEVMAADRAAGGSGLAAAILLGAPEVPAP